MSTAVPGGRFEDELDLVLHLLDRQVQDAEGALVGKVDDVELTHSDDGGLLVTGLLLGANALLPRLWRRGHELWVATAPQRPGQHVPDRIDLALVERLDSGVRLRTKRAGSAPPAPALDPDRVRLAQLLGGHVTYEGRPAGRVIDVRARPEEGRGLVVSHLVAGRGGPGSMLGYDRKADMGPWAVAAAVRLLHRGSYVVDVDRCAIDWTAGSVAAHGPRTPIAQDRERRRGRGPGARVQPDDGTDPDEEEG
jgi:hypothetical protein